MVSKNKPGVVVVGAEPKPGRRRLLVVALVAVVVMVVAGAAYGGYVYYTHKSQQSKAIKTAAPDQSAAAPAQPPTISEQAAVAGDYGQVAQLTKDQVGASTKPEDQLKLAVAYANAGQNNNAMVIYDKLKADGKLSASYLASAAETAAAAGDKPKAISYFEAAKAKLKADDAPTAADMTIVYDKRIQELRQ